MKKYNPKAVEAKWQKYWQDKKLFASKENAKKKKKFVLVEFPYPSGAGLHMGHLRSYTAADVYSRYFRMKGYEVMYPMGWDAFGLPAENYAIKTGKHPSTFTYQNIATFKKQINSIGYSFDWSREIDTTDPAYYKWTQWIFLQLYKKGLAYEDTGLINWCPKDKTGLANEEVVGGVCERCGTVVEKKELRQWYLKITSYAEKLLKGLEKVNWPEPVKLQQKNWIGKSVGAEISFRFASFKGDVKVFTTRPDTLFGVTYIVLAPEHLYVSAFGEKIENWEEVKKYIEAAKKKSEEARVSDSKEKTGVELKGFTVVNPATNEQIPVWIADYVLPYYGTGAIMAVPASDARDFAFAKKYNLKIKQVVTNQAHIEKLDEPFTGEGILIDSGEYTGKFSHEVRGVMAKKFGKSKVQYKMRDWVFSRQRYWGEPIPIIHCEACGVVPVPEKDLPVLLPKIKRYEPTGTGESPLAAMKDWVNVKCPTCKQLAKRETNTMPQWAGSSWYWLRYSDPKNSKALADKKKLAYWEPVDVYFGGMEHTTLHLLYSRFWNQFLYDIGAVTRSEPYSQRVPHGIILASDGEKMSKSRGNVVNPETYVKKWGADTTRLFELFLGPHESQVTWKDDGIIGVRRFLDRVWTWVGGFKEGDNSNRVERAFHRLIKKVGGDIESFAFNTAISSFMEFYNQVKDEPVSLQTVKQFLVLLYPFAPHIADELNSQLGGKNSLQVEEWPTYNPEFIVDETVVIVVQINGKVKAKMDFPKGSTQKQVEKVVVADKIIKNLLADIPIKKTIFVSDRLINFVV